MLEIQTYSPQTFWDEVGPQLRKHEAQNGLMLGLSQQFLSAVGDGVGQFAAYQGPNFLAALISSGRPYCNLIVSPLIEEFIAEKLAEAALAANVPIKGLVGPLATAEIYAKIFSAKGFTVTPLVRQGIYHCKAVKMPATNSATKFRLADENDIETVAEWMEAFRQEAVPHDPAVDNRKVAQERIRSQLVRILEKNDRSVSMATYGRDLGTSASVNFVYTPPEFRGHGYGSLVTAHLTKWLLENGRSEVCLYTDLANPTANKIYQNIGYEFVCNSIHFRLA